MIFTTTSPNGLMGREVATIVSCNGQIETESKLMRETSDFASDFSKTSPGTFFYTNKQQIKSNCQTHLDKIRFSLLGYGQCCAKA